MVKKYNLEYPVLDTGAPEVSLKYKLPENKRELLEALNGGEYAHTLSDIYELCRTVWKYEDHPSKIKWSLLSALPRRFVTQVY